MRFVSWALRIRPLHFCKLTLRRPSVIVGSDLFWAAVMFAWSVWLSFGFYLYMSLGLMFVHVLLFCLVSVSVGFTLCVKSRCCTVARLTSANNDELRNWKVICSRTQLCLFYVMFLWLFGFQAVFIVPSVVAFCFCAASLFSLFAEPSYSRGSQPVARLTQHISCIFANACCA